MAGIADEDIDLLDFGSSEVNQVSKVQQREETRSKEVLQKNSAYGPYATTSTTHPTSKGISLHRHPLPQSRAEPRASAISNVQGSNTKPKQILADFTEEFSGLRVRNRVLSAEDMRIRMKGRTMHRLGSLRTVPMRQLESQDPNDTWGTVGVLVSKSARRQASNGGSFSVWTLSDLNSKGNDLSVFLFKEALNSHWTACEGTLLAVVGSRVLPSKGASDNKLAVAVDTPWQIHKIGMAMDYALCKGTRKDGKQCTMPVDLSKGGFCEFHVVAAFNRAQRQGQGQGQGLDARRNKQEGNMNRLRSKLQISPAHAQMSTPVEAKLLPSTTAPSRSLSGILGAEVKRREDAGSVSRFGGASTGLPSSRASAGAKPLRPTAMRASGRTTLIPSPSETVGGTFRDKDTSDLSLTAMDTNSGEASTTKTRKTTEDVLGLTWSYGTNSKPDPKNLFEKSSTAPGAVAVRSQSDQKVTGKRPRDDGVEGAERSRVVDWRPPTESHPEGYQDGSVPVPAPSKIFMENAKKYNVRVDGTMSVQGKQQLDDAKMMRVQQLVKFKADQRGIQLKPANPSTAVARKPGVRPSLSILGSKGTVKLGSTLGTTRCSKGPGERDPLAKKIKTMSAAEKELLLRRVSKYAGLAEEERANEAEKSMQRLEQREAMADKADEVKQMSVHVFDCVECKMRRTYFSKRCRDLGHEQKRVKATLRFFECTNCRKRRSCTERMPQTGCEGCGKHDSWKRCGARPGRGPAEVTRDKRFVTALSEWTDQRDLSLGATDVR